jgi:DNA replication and repair protein RecF
MKLKQIKLQNFRLYEDAEIAFLPGLNQIVGPNAQGKTTLLEAIGCLISGHSFRTHQPQELIRHGASQFFIQAEFEKLGILQSVKLFYDGRKKTFYHNETKLKSGSAILGMLQGVIITPDHIQLIKGSPGVRRHFLDLLIAQTDPLYVYHLNRYMRGLQQRNALLRSRQLETLEAFESEMATSAGGIMQKRGEAVLSLQPLAQKIYQELSDEKVPISLNYKTIGQARSPEQILAQLAKHRRKEMEIGYTLTGPHRDDFLITMGEHEAKFFASEGQKHSLVLALYLAKWHQIKKLSDCSPLMLIDDVGIGLDNVRKGRLFHYLNHLGQVVITCCNS